MTKTEKAAYKARMDAIYAEAERVVSSGFCPQCGNTLYRNLSLTGWWQCNGYPTLTHRRPGHETDRKCDFQIFTRG